MSAALIEDFGLDAKALQDKHGDRHPAVTVHGWKRSVNNDSTMLGYWDFVAKRIEAYQEELDAANPYTQWMKEMEL